MNALIVDDSSAMRGILKRILSSIGITVVEAENGKEGLEQLRANIGSVKFLLVDWNMPIMNGLEMVKTLRSDARFAALKVVMISTETEPQRMAKALMCGVDEFVMKPFTKEVLVDKLRLVGVQIPK